ncbi:MAG TPA: LutB/LldF family L-lactate oxidation iron-sulfur protein [Candidatus Methylomirabilis sp.]|nr:LutB/LldF family L-lactate oxidation iron-sulfur protein [Candidatus Methylomirabilis sp.]
MQVTAMHFKRKAAENLSNEKLQRALEKLQTKFVNGRAAAIAELPNFDQIRNAAADVRERVINNLDRYLLRFEQEATARGAVVHWAETADDVNRIVADIAVLHGVQRIVKSKSMVSEECGLNDYLESQGLNVLETDLGEYILQLAHEPPSHIVAPVVHKTKEDIADLFVDKHHRPRTTQIAELCREAREVLRPGFLAADMGISGGNFIIAETGSVLIITNEGNGRLSTTLPRVHVAVTGIEKVVPTLEDVTTLLRLLPRSATGQSITNYVSVLTGVKGRDDADGAEHFHIILLDNGRSRLLGTELQPMLRCIRCGACMNHCPVYQNIGGHAYGWVYPGPMGSVLTPSFVGLENALDLPNASTFCGQCAVVCPVKIPLPDLMRHLRNRQVERHLRPWQERAALRVWSWMAQHPALYALSTRVAARLLRLFAGGKKRLSHLPGASGWTEERDMPAPAGRTFRDLYRVGRRA